MLPPNLPAFCLRLRLWLIGLLVSTRVSLETLREGLSEKAGTHEWTAHGATCDWGARSRCADLRRRSCFSAAGRDTNKCCLRSARGWEVDRKDVVVHSVRVASSYSSLTCTILLLWQNEVFFGLGRSKDHFKAECFLRFVSVLPKRKNRADQILLKASSSGRWRILAVVDQK